VDQFILAPRISLSAIQWYATGRELFQRKLYAQAASCFEKAHRPQDRDVATAYQKQKDAEKYSNPARRREAFKAAGDAFSLCGDQVGKAGRPHHMRAMQCYVEAGEEELAVRAHAKSIDETEAAQLLARNGQFDEALDLVRPTKGLSRVTPEVAKDITEQAKVAWLNEGRYKFVFTITLYREYAHSGPTQRRWNIIQKRSR
jgi:tetratricopeptide (TPR) repeat protein